MPCGRCQGTLVSIGGRLVCPRCKGIEIVPAADAAGTLKALARRAGRKLEARMRGYDRDDILRAAFGKREMVARGFLFGLEPIDIRTVLGCNAVLATLGAKKARSGGRRADPARLHGLVQGLGSMLFRLEKAEELEAGTYSLFRAEKYSLNDLVSDDSGAFPLHPNERDVSAFGARSDLGMITQSQAARRAPPPPDGGIGEALGTKKGLTVEEVVRDCYHHAYMFADIFFGTPVRGRYGAPPDLDKVKIPPLRLKKFVSLFPCDMDNITVCGASQFEALARRVFGGEYPDFERNFVMSDGRPGAFPLFMAVGGRVHVSHFIGEFYSYALLTVVHRAELDQETQRRSKEYESEVVPAHFKNRGYAYYADQRGSAQRDDAAPDRRQCSRGSQPCTAPRGGKKKLQIDGIAVSSGAAYVIEAKYWNPRKCLGGAGRYGAHDDMARGSIEGTRLDRATGKWKRRGAALADKVEWVEKNRARYGILDGTPVKRALVTNTHPVAREYKGCEIIHVPDPDALGVQDDAGGPAGGGAGMPATASSWGPRSAPPHGGRSP